MEANAIRIIITGISGSGRSAAIRDLESYLKTNYPNKKLIIMKTNDMMIETAKELGMDVKEEKLLDMSPPTLQSLRSTVFEKILSRIEDIEEENENVAIVLNTHATFRWRERLLQGWDFFYLHKIKPDLFITIINHLSDIYNELEENALWGGMNSQKTIGIWQEEEEFTTKLMAEIRQKPFYIVARRQPPETLYKLIFEHDTSEKVYLSYPMTHISEDEEKKKEITDLARDLRDLGWVVFDPGTMELAKVHDDFLSPDLRKYDFAQTVYRDFQLIDQGTMVVIYYPSIVHSSGVVSEQVYGFRNNKYVFAVFPATNYSPFTSFFADKVFSDKTALMKFLKEDFIPAMKNKKNK